MMTDRPSCPSLSLQALVRMARKWVAPFKAKGIEGLKAALAAASFVQAGAGLHHRTC
jgi:hypothetical protein